MQSLKSLAYMSRPTVRAKQSFAHWVRGKDGLTDQDKSILNQHEDFVCLAEDKEMGYLDHVIRRLIT